VSEEELKEKWANVLKTLDEPLKHNPNRKMFSILLVCGCNDRRPRSKKPTPKS
jgi:hypothetical protein